MGQGTRALAIAACIGVAGVAAGCSTQPATDVGPGSATLNARLVNPLPDESYRYHFEYVPDGLGYDWATSTPEATLAPKTDWRDVSASVVGLGVKTTYHFRVCGTFVPSGRSACLPCRTFTTPDGDTLDITGATADDFLALRDLDVHVASGPDGSRPTGTMRFTVVINGNVFPRDAKIGCLRTDGHTAVLGDDTGSTTFFITDNGGDDDTVAVRPAGVPGPDDKPIPARTPGDCGPRTAADPAFRTTLTSGRAVVRDAP